MVGPRPRPGLRQAMALHRRVPARREGDPQHPVRLHASGLEAGESQLHQPRIGISGRRVRGHHWRRRLLRKGSAGGGQRTVGPGDRGSSWKDTRSRRGRVREWTAIRSRDELLHQTFAGAAQEGPGGREDRLRPRLAQQQPRTLLVPFAGHPDEEGFQKFHADAFTVFEDDLPDMYRPPDK